MIILNSQATKLQAKLAAAGTLVNFFGVYADNGTAFAPGQNNVASNGTTYVDVVSAPQSGQRQVKNVYAYNGDSVAHTVTFAHYDGTTTRILNIVTLVPGASIDLIPGRGLYGAITGPTDSTLVQTGTTLAINLANANTWMAPQTFSAGLSGALTGTASGNIPMVTPGTSGNVLSSNGTAWTSAAPSVAWGNVTGTLSNQTDLATALAAKEPSIAPGTTSQYWRGDKTWQPINWLTSETDPVFTAWKAATPPLYAEVDTLASVTARGATTSVASSFTGGLSASTVSAGSLNVQTPTTSTVGAIIKGYSGQTADLQQWQGSTGAVVARVTKDGYLGTHGVSATSASGWTIFEGTPGNYDKYLNFAIDGATKVRFAPDGSLSLYVISVTNDTYTGNLRAQNDRLAMWGQGISISSPGMAMKWASVNSPWYSATYDVSLSETSAGVLQVGDGGVNANGTITAKSFRLRAYTVATLPAGTQGDTAYVTDALNPAYLAAVSGGGAVVTPVFFDGTNWVCH